MRRTGTLAATLLLALLALVVVFLVGMRKKSPRVLGAVRRVNRAVFNPLQLRSAGRPGSYASVVHHVGRVSGNDYVTPVVAVPVDDGLVIALVYGSHADWMKNVLVAGEATIDHEGESFRVDQPEIVPIDEVEAFTPAEQRTHRRFGVDRGLRVRRVATPAAESAG